MDALLNPSTEGDELVPGHEPVIAPGVRGVWFDLPDALYVSLVVAERPGSGAVGRMIDGLPVDRRIVFSVVLSPVLAGMLERRGFHLEQLCVDGWDFDAYVRAAIPGTPGKPPSTPPTSYGEGA